MQSEKFGRLLKAIINSIATQEGKTNPIIEDELGQKVGVSAASIQRYKAGHIPPEVRTIEIFAEAAVKRGGYSREWLQNFLHSARHPHPDKVLDQLCPINSNRSRPERVYHNLPAPTYSQFVMREQAFNEILDGLSQRSAVVLLAGMGGMGKTSLAREIAEHCIKENLFEASVWVSDKDRPGTTTLSIVLDEIARTLDYPGLTQFEHEEKIYEVEQLLRRQKVLLIIDNFETTTDSALLSWLLRLPEPSKALLTTREYRREFRRSSWPIDLRGMVETEAQELISQKLRQLKIEHQLTDWNQLAPLLAITSGNPKAIEMALGYIKYQRQPLQQVIADLYAARGELFDDLFDRCWSLLDEASRRVLLSMTFFVDSAKDDALSTVAGFEGFAFNSAKERLIDLAFLDTTQQGNLSELSRYFLHPLVKAFATSQLENHQGFSDHAKERWIQYFNNFVHKWKDGDWDNGPKYAILEAEIENIEAVLDYCYISKYRESLIQMVLKVRSFWNTRGDFDTAQKFINYAIEINIPTGDQKTYLELLFLLTHNFYYRGDLESSIKTFDVASTLLKQLSNPDLEFYALSNFAQYRICELQGNFEEMKHLAEKNFQLAVENNWDERKVIAKFDLAVCLYYTNNLYKAEELLLEALTWFIENGHLRSTIYATILLAKITLTTNRPFLTENYLNKAYKQAALIKHRRYLAEINFVRGQYNIFLKKPVMAGEFLIDALNVFERLGMRHEVSRVNEQLAYLKEVFASEKANETT